VAAREMDALLTRTSPRLDWPRRTASWFVAESSGYLSRQFAKNHSHLVNSLAG